MTAYVLVEAEVLDKERADRYRELAEPSIFRYGGRYLIQGTVPQAAEGTWPSARVTTVVEFPNMDRLKEWYASAEYAQAKAAREGAIEVRLLFAEGKAA
ncbi:DUF1330 domain-containing protein [Streptomyces zagrosensis]|uniref:Uncharacterized protein (DUF1330 family) n=1 Tax=Streptomyces zagrosensis TaxID=1042984 RepID=A0A7W9Q8Z2_9ACTN|nr:DUF1330 domain-containing protein [Streptomyces zagrosensis]MBB5935559.1 uncharacterized protein (DUF1330 family) [Streptomyces zagrosensis]